MNISADNLVVGVFNPKYVIGAEPLPYCEVPLYS